MSEEKKEKKKVVEIWFTEFMHIHCSIQVSTATTLHYTVLYSTMRRQDGRLTFKLIVEQSTV